jgi:NTP pyrophosphatase (non-canonical NTP hydrolase)
MQIHEFQEMMRQLYFKRDSERGINGTFNWLVDEVEELGEELKKGTDREATEKEFADVIAWLASLANILEIDLEEAAVNKYSLNTQNASNHHASVLFNLGVSALTL